MGRVQRKGSLCSHRRRIYCFPKPKEHIPCILYYNTSVLSCNSCPVLYYYTAVLYYYTAFVSCTITQLSCPVLSSGPPGDSRLLKLSRLRRALWSCCKNTPTRNTHTTFEFYNHDAPLSHHLLQ
ncbi:unnamed protein product [Arctogadus glacialis]